MDVVIMHGTGGSPEGNWFPWLKAQLELRGHKVFVPRFPTPENQTVKNWCKVLSAEAPLFGENTILIGHSCGAAYLLNVLMVLPGPVAKSIFVSPFAGKLGNQHFDMLNKDFVERNFDWEKIRRNMGAATLFYGDDDPYVPRACADYVSEKLGVPLTVIPGGGHLNAESGYTKFHELLKILN